MLRTLMSVQSVTPACYLSALHQAVVITDSEGSIEGFLWPPTLGTIRLRGEAFGRRLGFTSLFSQLRHPAPVSIHALYKGRNVQIDIEIRKPYAGAFAEQFVSLNLLFRGPCHTLNVFDRKRQPPTIAELDDQKLLIGDIGYGPDRK